MDEELGEDGYPPGWPAPLRDLRRVVPIAQTVTVGGVVLTAVSLDDFPVGFTVRLRLLLADGHPIVEEQRRQDVQFQDRQAEVAQRSTAAGAGSRRGARTWKDGRSRSSPQPSIQLPGSCG